MSKEISTLLDLKVKMAENRAKCQCLAPFLLLLSVCLVLCLSRTVLAQTPILEYKFNETGSTAPSSGSNATALTLKDSTGAATDLHSADGLGVSGSAGDRAFDNTASTTMGGSGGRAEQADLAAIDILTSFTLQGWFKTDGTTILGTNARLFYNFAGSNGFDLYGKSTINGDMTLGVDNGDANTSGTIYGDTQTWVFFAVTYDGTLASDNVKFYKGSGTSTVTQVGTNTVNKAAVNGEAAGLGIGNKSGSSNFPFDGFLDNIRIFGSQSDNSGVLTLTQLETLRSGDVPPSVISTRPASGITDVGTNVIITATFSETMDSSTIGTSTFTVNDGSNNATGTVSYSGTKASFTPSANLSASTTYTATITTGAKDSTGDAMTSNYTWSFSTGSGPDTTSPTVSSTIPANGATDVAINSPVRATFSEAMDAATITTSTFTVSDGSSNVTGTISYGSTTATFTPSSDLSRSTTYTVTITTGATDVTGNAIAANFTWNFTTGTSADNTPPRVDSTSPSSDATGVALNTTITATFSEAMDSSTIGTSTFTVSTGGSNISGTVSYSESDTTATFTPSNNLSFSTIYTATISTGVKDLVGNAKASDSTWNFTTQGAPVPEPTPFREKFTVNSVDPANGATDVPIDTLVSATFSMFINGSTFNTDTFKLSDGVNEVTGTVTTDGATASFTPLENLVYNTTYTARITTRAQAANFAGTTLDADFTWSFTTIPDAVSPTVIFTSPDNGATDVAIDSVITVTFSETMDATTIGTSTFSFSGVTCTVDFNGTTTTATFTPSRNLDYSTTYTGIITTGVRDLNGNALAQDYTWGFTTVSAPDTIPPTVISTSPVNGDADVPINSIITATFSEEMDVSTITTDTFIVNSGNGNIGGTVSYDGTTATFTPFENLNFNAPYTATITTGVRDLAGNAMVFDFAWNFITESVPAPPTPFPTATPMSTPTPSLTATPTSAPTPSPTPTVTPSPTPARSLNLSKEVAYLSGDTIVVSVVDNDRNNNLFSEETLTTTLKVTGENYFVGTDLLLDLKEDGINSGTFLATIKTGTITTGGASSSIRTNNVTIKPNQGGIATVIYTDTVPLAKTLTFRSFDATVAFNADTYSVGSYAEITLSDAERNTNHEEVESLLNDVSIETSSINSTKVRMVETGADTGTFMGSFQVVTSGGTLEFERIQVTAGDTLRAVYVDQITTTGFPKTVMDTAIVVNVITPTPSATPTVTTTPTATVTSTPTPASTLTPTPTPTQLCVASSLEAEPDELEISKKESATVTVTLTGEDGCPVSGQIVKAKIASSEDKEHIKVEQKEQTTDDNGQATFTITARKKTGKAKVKFKTGGLKAKVKVNITE